MTNIVMFQTDSAEKWDSHNCTNLLVFVSGREHMLTVGTYVCDERS